MGSSSSMQPNKNYSSSSVSSSSSDDSDEYESLHSDMEEYYVSRNVEDGVKSDASFMEQAPVQTLRKLTEKDLNLLNDNLDLDEKVSIVYLLHDNPNKAYHEITNLKDNPNANVVKDWAIEEQKTNQKCNTKILEALCIIKNFQIIRLLGYTKNDLNVMFLPTDAHVRLQVSLPRKATYCIFETLRNAHVICLKEELRRDLQRKGLNYDAVNEPNLELLFLNLERQNYISFNNIKNVAQVFKYADMENECEMLMYVNNKISTNDIPTTTFGEMTLQTGASSSSYNIDETATTGNRHVEEVKRGNFKYENRTSIVRNADDKYYKVDPKKPGYLLIVNNEDFFTEFRPEFKALIEKNIDLENRQGTAADGKALEETFRELNFQVKCADNIMHDGILKELEVAVNKVCEEGFSSLFVTILSHGKKGAVYGCNSIAVEIERTIQPILCTQRLSGVPKVLLIQACQGNTIQKIEIDDELQTDGPSASPVYTPPPKMQDLLIFHSTIPNYAAFRHTRNGSWFIQSLCEKIKAQKDSDHFQDICTSVNSDVGSRNWNGNIMVSIFSSTFTKKLYLSGAR